MNAIWGSARRWLREPLLHFLVIGLLLFVGYRMLHPELSRAENVNRIDLTTDDLRQLEDVWMTQWHRPPTPGEMSGLIDARVREEVLYREALLLGLDQGDTIIKRRLAQKFEFLADNVSALNEPTADELRAWYAMNSERFAESGRRSFRHIYFSTDRRGEHAREDAERTLARLANTSSDSSSIAAVGDPFMFQDFISDRAPEQIASIFGSAFAAAVDKLPPGSWQGPVQSGLGWHLVFVTSVTPGHVPSYEEIEADIRTGWLDDQRAEARQRAFSAMRAHYEVHVPDATEVAVVLNQAPTGSTP